MEYKKLPIDFPEQLLKLRERGMIITNDNKALELLGSISYFRLASYWHSMEIDTDSDNHQFLPNTHFEDVIDLYLLDEELRALIFTAIQNIEVALRTRVIHNFSMKWSSFWFMDPSLLFPNFRKTFLCNG